MSPVRFTYHAPGGDRRHFVNGDDVAVVLSRLPVELWERLRAVHFNDRSRGGKVMGYVNRGRREIALCALPPRVSLSAVLRRRRNVRPGRPPVAPSHFGAARGQQWPEVAVRRFMLYDTLLHELGHLQVVDPKAKNNRRQFGHERVAEEFSVTWRRRLWSQPFDHADPAHHPPGAMEFRAPRGILCPDPRQAAGAVTRE